MVTLAPDYILLFSLRYGVQCIDGLERLVSLNEFWFVESKKLFFLFQKIERIKVFFGRNEF